MGKRKDRNHELERYSRGRLQMALSRWVVNALDEDYAFDFAVRPTEGFETDSRGEYGNRVLPSPFYVQLKSSDRFGDSGPVWWEFETEYLLDDCLPASIPVVLVVCDRTREELYWCVLQSYCWDVLDQERSGWRDQSTVRVTVTRGPLAESVQLAELCGAVRNAEHRLSTRQYVAAARRGTLHQSATMGVASTTQVREYKRAIVDDALDLADAGRIERALGNLMEIYQMAEDDEPTLAAVRLLLEWRPTDNPSIALTKLQLAYAGLHLSGHCDREELCSEFETDIEAAATYLDETFVGSRYRGPDGMPIRVLAVEGAQSLVLPTIAHVQHGFELTKLRAQTIATTDRYELIDAGDSYDPSLEACPEHDHEFEQDSLRDAPLTAICSECGLSYEVIQQWLSHDVPHVCDDCGDTAYNVVFQLAEDEPRERCLCAECES